MEHVEEDGKAMLYLVRVTGAARGAPGAQRCHAQVFEYLDTDLKKFMDLTGRGPTNPLPKSLVQVRFGPARQWVRNHTQCSRAAAGGTGRRLTPHAS